MEKSKNQNDVQNEVQSENAFEEIFKMNTDLFLEKEKDYDKENDMYVPNLAKTKDGIYKSIIRFIPNISNPKEPFIKKYVYWLDDPITGEKFSVDCPSNVGKPSILQELFFKYNSSKSYEEKEYAKYFKRSLSCYALIQVVKDDNDPESEGKLKIFRFGQKIYNMIKGENQPEINENLDPFHPIIGRNLYLVITKVANNNNYDQSKFFGKSAPIVIDGIPITDSKEDKIKLFDYLKNNSPSLDKFKYQEWTEEKTEKVYNYIKHVLPQKEIIKIDVLSREQNMTNTASQSPINITSSSPIKNSADVDPFEPEITKTNPSSLDIDDSFFNELENIDDVPF